MTFSKEDKNAWLNSETMTELEKFAEDVLDTEPPDSWEEEDDTTKLIDATEEFNKPEAELLSEEELEELPEELPENDTEEDLLLAHYNNTLLDGVTKISYELVNKSNIRAAYKVERILQNIKKLLEE